MRNLILSFILAILSSCTYKIPITPKVGAVDHEQINDEAYLVFSPSEKKYVYFTSPQGRSDYTAEFPVGQALFMASQGVYSQVFPQLKQVSTLQEVPQGALAIVPEFISMDYRFVFPRGHFTRLSVKVTFREKEKIIAQKVFSGKEYGYPDTGKGSWERQVGQSVADGMAEALKNSLVMLPSSSLNKDKVGRGKALSIKSTIQVKVDEAEAQLIPKEQALKFLKGIDISAKELSGESHLIRELSIDSVFWKGGEWSAWVTDKKVPYSELEIAANWVNGNYYIYLCLKGESHNWAPNVCLVNICRYKEEVQKTIYSLFSLGAKIKKL